MWIISEQLPDAIDNKTHRNEALRVANNFCGYWLRNLLCGFQAEATMSSLDFASMRSPEKKESPTAEDMAGAMVWGYGLRSRRPWAPTRLPGTSAVGCVGGMGLPTRAI